MDKVEVLAACLANNTGVAAVDIDVCGDVLPELAEDVGAASEVESGEQLVVNALRNDFRRRTGGELDDARRYTSLGEDLMANVVGVSGRRRRLPDNDIAEHSGGGGKVTTDGGEVERGNGEDKAFKRAIFRAAGEESGEGTQYTQINALPSSGRVARGLYGIQLAHILDTKAQEIGKLNKIR